VSDDIRRVKDLRSTQLPGKRAIDAYFESRKPTEMPCYDCPVQRIVLVNPNTSTATTDRMVAVARKHLERGFSLEAVTAASGAQLIVNEDQLGVAARAVAALAPGLAATSDGVIISAFGDPGVDELRQRITQPVVGIAESAMREAARGEHRFSIVTTTPELVDAMKRRAQRLGFGCRLASVRVTDGPLDALMTNEAGLIEALFRAADVAIRQDGAQAVIVGGGPLAAVADQLRSLLSVPVVEPIPAAVSGLQAVLQAG
jgi:Asp/Glu/hydantoin racemase